MIRDTLVPIAESLFWLTNGELLLNSWWFIPWILGGTVLLLIPFYLAIVVGKNKIQTLPAIVFLISFFPMLLLIISPGIIQAQLISECRNSAATLTVNDVSQTTEIRQCRVKENYYDSDYGEWWIVQNGG
jgi:hypothetical protein